MMQYSSLIEEFNKRNLVPKEVLPTRDRVDMLLVFDLSGSIEDVEPILQMLLYIFNQYDTDRLSRYRDLLLDLNKLYKKYVK